VLQLVFSEEKHGVNRRGRSGHFVCLKMESRVHPELPSSERMEADRAAVGRSYFLGIVLPVPVLELQ
jgi:hypothetical protein